MRTRTLLQRIASNASLTGRVRLRAIELMMVLDGDLDQRNVGPLSRIDFKKDAPSEAEPVKADVEKIEGASLALLLAESPENHRDI